MSEHGGRVCRPRRSAVLPAWLNAVLPAWLNAVLPAWLNAAEAHAGGPLRAATRSDQETS